MTRRTRKSFVVPLLSLVAACTGGQAEGIPEPEEPPPVPVRVAPIVIREITRPIVGTGTLGAKEEVALSFKVGGIIDRIDVDAGAVVRAGQTLAALELGEIDAAVARARSAAEQAERAYARARRLYADSVVPLARLQDAETAAAVARAELERTLFNRRFAVVVAPSDGVVLRRHKEPGELVAPGEPVLVLASRARGSVLRVGLADRDVVRVREGDAADVRFEALPDRRLHGTVTQVGTAAQPGTGTYLVEIALPAADDLVSGLVGTAEIRSSTPTLAKLIPVEALLEADGSRGTVYALAADGRSAERREVTIDFLAGDRVAIAAGLDGVASVVTAGAAYLNDGAAVVVSR
ncbi:MAG TPA: efflux RND transporter periplasmic adaptor subunit [Longimicrobiales bacterium]